MGPSGFDDALVFFFEAAERRSQLVDCGQDLVLQREDSGNVHCRGERVVRRLGHVDIVVRVQQLFACQLIAAVGNDLVGVHVGLRAGSGLPDDQREMVVQLAGRDLLTGLLDDGELFGGHLFGLERMVGARGGLLQDAEGMGDLARHRLKAHADREILVAALGLCGPVFVGRNLDLAHGIMLDAVFHRVCILQL